MTDERRSDPRSRASRSTSRSAPDSARASGAGRPGRAGGRRDRPGDQARRGPRPRRRIRLGQDDDRPGDRRSSPARPPAVCSSTASTSPTRAGGDLQRYRTPDRDDLPGPVRDAQPEADDLRLRRRAAGRQRRCTRARRSDVERVVRRARVGGSPTRRGRSRARYPHELSGGQRQRVVIAGALVLGPELVVADEPVSMLDVSIRTELLRLMLDLRAERDLTYLFITHDLSLAWVIADRVAVMYLGKIMEIGPANAVISAPRHPYTAALVSVAPSPEPPAPGERAKRTILVGRDTRRLGDPDRLPIPHALSAGVREMRRGAAAHPARGRTRRGVLARRDDAPGAARGNNRGGNERVGPGGTGANMTPPLDGAELDAGDAHHMTTARVTRSISASSRGVVATSKARDASDELGLRSFRPGIAGDSPRGRS